MKRSKFALVALALIAGLVSTFAFTSHKAQKPSALKYYYFVGENNAIGSLDVSDLQDPDMWEVGETAPGTSQPGFLNAIVFLQETTPNENAAITKAQAIAAVAVHYDDELAHDFDLYSFEVGVGGDATTVTIYARASN